MSRQLFALVAVALATSACAGRAPNPVPVVQATDRTLDCTMIMAEVQANDSKLAQLARDEGGKVAQNVAAGVIGLFFWPALFAMDFQGTASKETTALQQRQSYLATLATERQCAGAPAPVASVGGWR